MEDDIRRERELILKAQRSLNKLGGVFLADYYEQRLNLKDKAILEEKEKHKPKESNAEKARVIGSSKTATDKKIEQKQEEPAKPAEPVAEPQNISQPAADLYFCAHVGRDGMRCGKKSKLKYCYLHKNLKMYREEMTEYVAPSVVEREKVLIQHSINSKMKVGRPKKA